MTRRDKLNGLFHAREQLDNLIRDELADYIDEEPKALLYISDHAIDRFRERVLNGDNETKPETIREMMLTYEEQKKILEWGIEKFDKPGYSLIIKGITVVTTISND